MGSSFAEASLFEERLPDRYPKLVNLYEKAKRDFWNETTAIDWDQPTTLSPDHRVRLARLLSITYYGERAAMTIAAQLVASVPDEEARQVLSCQVIEEAKHVGAFQRLLKRLDRIHPPSYFARKLLVDLCETEEPVAKLVGMHLFVENIANHSFNALREGIDDPVVRQVLEYVARDEKKHTAIAVLYLPSLLAKLPAHKAAWLYAKQVKWLTLGLCMVKDGYEDARALNIDLASAGQKALHQHYKLRESMSSTRGLLDVPYFDKVIEAIAGWVQQK
ncbi:MAG: ferritin-like domain-containing protein [Deltaproteobacteria bacterium]|nr:ferritin-like domain-containing protein [Deltaproteobacteria bacterium]